MKRLVYLKNIRVAIDGILEVGLLFVEHYYSCYYYFYDYSYPKSYFAIVAIIFLYVFVWFYDIFLFIRRFSCVFCLLYEFSRGETCYLNWKFLKTFMKKKIKVAPEPAAYFMVSRFLAFRRQFVSVDCTESPLCQICSGLGIFSILVVC